MDSFQPCVFWPRPNAAIRQEGGKGIFQKEVVLACPGLTLSRRFLFSLIFSDRGLNQEDSAICGRWHSFTKVHQRRGLSSVGGATQTISYHSLWGRVQITIGRLVQQMQQLELAMDEHTDRMLIVTSSLIVLFLVSSLSKYIEFIMESVIGIHLLSMAKHCEQCQLTIVLVSRH